MEFKVDSENIFIQIINENSNYKRICSCGFKSEDNLLDFCPNCNTKKEKITHYVNAQYYKIKYINFNKKSFYMDVDLYQIKANFDLITINYLIKIENITKNNKVKTIGKIIENGNEVKFKKNILYFIFCNVFRNDSNRKAFEVLNKITFEESNRLDDVLWSIFNRYKCGYNLYDNHIKMLGSPITQIKKLNDLLFDLNITDKGMIDDLFFISSSFSYLYSSMDALSVINFIEDYMKNKDISDIEKDAKKARSVYDKKDVFEDLVGRNIHFIIDLVSNTNLTVKEVINILEIAKRQNYDPKEHINLYNITETYLFSYKCGIPLNKNPKDIYIYINKIQAIKKKFLADNFDSYYHALEKSANKYLPNKYECVHSYDLIRYIQKNHSFNALEKIIYSQYQNYYNTFNKISNNRSKFFAIKEDEQIIPIIFSTNDNKKYTIYFDNNIKEIEIDEKDLFENIENIINKILGGKSCQVIN